MKKRLLKNFSYHKIASIIAFAFALVAVLSAAFYASSSDMPIASAADGDTFEVVFPFNSYFQCGQPTLIAANDNYLAVLDKASNIVFTRNEVSKETAFYPLDDVSPNEMFVVSNAIVFNTGSGFYLLNMAASDGAVSPVELQTPENITALTSDGTYLYAKSTGGYLSVYEFDGSTLKIATEFEANNRYNEDVLAGRAVLAAENGELYLFSNDDKNFPKLYVYDVKTDSKTLQADTRLVQAAYAGDVIFAQISDTESVEDHGQLVCIDKTSGDVLFISQLKPNNFCANKNKLYATEGDHITVYTMSLTGGAPSLAVDETISMSGSDLLHLDAPVDIVNLGGKLAVADSGNSRVAIIDGESALTEVKTTSPIVRLTADRNDLYGLTAEGDVYRISGDAATMIASLPGATDIAYGDKLYALSSDGIYALQSNKFIRIANVSGGFRIAIADKGENIYVLKANSVEMYSFTGYRVAANLSANLAGAKDFAVDYGGNFTVLYQDKIETYANRLSSAELIGQTPLINANAKATANSAAFVGNELYFTADECLVGRLATDAVTEATFSPLPAVEGADGYRFIKLPEGATTFALTSTGRIDEAFNAPTDTLLALDKECDLGENYVYALYGSKLIIVAQNAFNEVQPATLSGDYVAKDNIKLYKLPYFDDGAITLEKGAKMAILSDVAGYDGNVWRIVKVGDNNYFVKADDIVKYIETIPEQSKTMGKAKAKRVGGLVGVYDAPSLDAAKITEIVDGTRLEVLETLDDYYLVQIGDTVGYMLKSEVKIGVLTTVQIVSIVLSVFVLIAGTIIFVAIYFTKRRAEND